ncbi:hypothetical protein J6590_075506 [Homalodisca vitripennis]|nr:hypothetical protein J6590_075506 [Homalodisca vitripennis]
MPRARPRNVILSSDEDSEDGSEWADVDEENDPDESVSVDTMRNALKLVEKWAVVEFHNQDGIQLYYLCVSGHCTERPEAGGEVGGGGVSQPGRDTVVLSDESVSVDTIRNVLKLVEKWAVVEFHNQDGIQLYYLCVSGHYTERPEARGEVGGGGVSQPGRDTVVLSDESVSVDTMRNALKLVEKWAVVEFHNQDGIQLYYLCVSGHCTERPEAGGEVGGGGVSQPGRDTVVLSDESVSVDTIRNVLKLVEKWAVVECHNQDGIQFGHYTECPEARGEVGGGGVSQPGRDTVVLSGGMCVSGHYTELPETSGEVGGGGVSQPGQDTVVLSGGMCVSGHYTERPESRREVGGGGVSQPGRDTVVLSGVMCVSGHYTERPETSGEVGGGGVSQPGRDTVVLSGGMCVSGHYTERPETSGEVGGGGVSQPGRDTVVLSGGMCVSGHYTERPETSGEVGGGGVSQPGRDTVVLSGDESVSVDTIRNVLKLVEKWEVVECHNQDRIKLYYLGQHYEDEGLLAPIVQRIQQFQ